jgi:hypothetical protein
MSSDVVERYRDLGARLGRLSATARSADGCVAVTVRPGGVLDGLALTEDALWLGADALAALIAATTRQAQATLAARVQACVAS